MARNAEDPAQQAGPALVPLDRTEDLEEDILGDVLGLGRVAEPTERESEHTGMHVAVQLGVGLLVTCPQSNH
jgi:hypothetical protein